jgi:CheY-like chemotaxis protein
MFQKSYPVLLVDDDPDVLSVSKLALRSMTVYGVPLDITVAASKAEAIELLQRRATALQTGDTVAPFFVALIDVVMETNTAGLELCAYMRETLKDKTTQIYVRTGQAGLAPERAVIDRYDINGYFTKAEMTEQKLYTVVKAGVRQVHNAARMEVAWSLIDAMVTYSATKEGIAQVLKMAIQSLTQGAEGRPANDSETRVGVIVDGKVVANAMEIDDAALLARSDALAAMEGKPYRGGGRWIVDGGQMQVSVPAGPAAVEVRSIAVTTGEPQEFMVEPYYRLIGATAGLWKRAA